MTSLTSTLRWISVWKPAVIWTIRGWWPGVEKCNINLKYKNKNKLECGPTPNTMAPWEYRRCHLLKITRSKSSVIPLLVRRREVWLTPTARVLCSNAANIGARKSWTQSEFCTWQNSVRQQPPKRIHCTSPGEGQTSCKVWLISGERRRCSKKPSRETRWNLLGCPKLPNWSQPLVG